MRQTVLLTFFASICLTFYICGSSISWKKEKYFTLVGSKRIDIKFRTITVNSKIECCAECARDNRCVSVSVNTISSTCWMHEANLYYYHEDNITDDISWSVYTKTCDAGWWLYKQSCYLCSPGKKDWYDGYDECHDDHDAHLLKIEDQVMQDVIIANCSDGDVKIWTGLNDIFTEDIFTWKSDESAPTFKSWDTNPLQPDSKTGDEDCVGLDPASNKWFDARCTNRYKIVCQKNV